MILTDSSAACRLATQIQSTYFKHRQLGYFLIWPLASSFSIARYIHCQMAVSVGSWYVNVKFNYHLMFYYSLLGHSTSSPTTNLRESSIISTPQCHHYLPPDVLLTFSSGLQSVTTSHPQRQPTPTTVYHDKHLGSVCVL